MKTLSFLACLVVVGGLTSIAHAENAQATSSLIISDEVYVPSKASAGETNTMPVTAAPEIEAHAEPETLTPLPVTKALVIEPQNVAVKHDEPVILSWRARGGEKLQDVLSRWGNRAGKNFQWTTRDTAELHRNFSFFGTYQDAVFELLKRESKPAAYVDNYTSASDILDTGVKKND